TTRLHLNSWSSISYCLLENIERWTFLFSFNCLKRLIENAFRQASLAIDHHFADEAGHISALIFCIRLTWPSHHSLAPWHISSAFQNVDCGENIHIATDL